MLWLQRILTGNSKHVTNCKGICNYGYSSISVFSAKKLFKFFFFSSKKSKTSGNLKLLFKKGQDRSGSIQIPPDIILTLLNPETPELGSISTNCPNLFNLHCKFHQICSKKNVK